MFCGEPSDSPQLPGRAAQAATGHGPMAGINELLCGKLKDFGDDRLNGESPCARQER
jgi:hypothetical protein